MDRWFLVDEKGMFMDSGFQFTCYAPYDDNIYSAATRGAAWATKGARGFPDTVKAIRIRRPTRD